MPTNRSKATAYGRIVSRRLDQLRATLDALKTRLRATVAGTVGETIGEVVRDVLFHVLEKLPPRLPPPRSPTYRAGDGWEERRTPHDDPYRDDDDGGYWQDEPFEEELQPLTPSAARQVLPLQVQAALSAGFYAAAWWLQRWQGRWRTLTTLVIGLLATGAAYVGGPLAVGMNLAASVTQLGWLADAVSSDASPFAFLRPK
jgi:hypothetical protein